MSASAMPHRIAMVALGVLFAVLCFFAFRPNESFGHNNLRVEHAAGMVFSPNSAAYVWNLFPANGDVVTKSQQKLSLHIRSAHPQASSFGIIFQIYNSETQEELTLGQWESSLVLLNSSDYSNSRRMPKLYAQLDGPGMQHDIVILIGPGGTTIEVNEQHTEPNQERFLSIPEPREKNVLILGNGSAGLSPWTGVIRDISLHDVFHIDFTESQTLEFRHDAPRNTILSSDALRQERREIVVPNAVFDLSPNFLSLRALRSFDLGFLTKDIVLNVSGFVPLGFLLAYVLKRGKPGSPWYSALAAAFICAAFSFCIESTQYFMPGRDSSLLDLILNSGGGAAGACLTLFFRRWKPEETL